MDKNVSMCSANREKVPGPAVIETCHASRVCYHFFATLIGISQEPSKEEIEREVRRCTCLFSIMLVCLLVTLDLLFYSFLLCYIIDRHCYICYVNTLLS